MVQGGTGDGWKEPKERRNQGGFVFNRKAYRQRKERTWVFPASLQVEQKGVCGTCLYDTRIKLYPAPLQTWLAQHLPTKIFTYPFHKSYIGKIWH